MAPSNRFPHLAVVLSVLMLCSWLGAGSAAQSAAPALSVRVSGNHLVDGRGSPVRLLGVNRSGSEYACVQGWGLSDGPTDDASVAAIASWHTNAVRVPLNEDCWLGINGSPASYSGPAYRAAIAAYVAKLHAAGLVAVLDLHWNAPGTTLATGQQVMADADHAPAFWSSVAGAFRADPAVAFDLYNEPHDLSWSCWRDGCPTAAGWRTAGMQSLVDAVRATGATQPVLVGGLGWASDLTGWLAYRPVDPAGQLAASTHLYNFSGCATVSCWDATLAPVAAAVPLVTGEVGENGCVHRFSDAYSAWADSHGVSYLGWSWNTADCSSGPALISRFDGTPTAFGTGLRDHLAALAGAPPVVASPTPDASPTLSPAPTRGPSAVPVASATPAASAGPTATSTGSSAPPSVPVSGFGYEDGTTQGWSPQWGSASVSNSAEAAFSGARSLAVTVAGGYPAVGVRTALGGLAQGSHVVAHLLVPAAGPALWIEPFTQDTSWVTMKAPAVLASPGAWTTVSWTVPVSGAITVLGLQVDAGGWSGQVRLDGISWTSPHLVGFDDGSVAGWSVQWGAGAVSVASDPTHSGAGALAVSVGGGYPAVGTRRLDGLQPGGLVSLWVHLPAGAPPINVEPFSQDGAYVVHKVAAVTLAPGVWTPVSWSLPAQGALTVLGLQVDAGSWSGALHLDDVRW